MMGIAAVGTAKRVSTFDVDINDLERPTAVFQDTLNQVRLQPVLLADNWTNLTKGDHHA
jgi:hypothetical protein